jgi:hypothetical protein
MELVPLESRFLKPWKAALFKRPTGAPPPVPPAARGVEGILEDLGPCTSSRDPMGFQPAEVPWKRTGWQSCPAATRASSAVHVSVTYGSVVVLSVIAAGAAGYTIVTVESWPIHL